VTAKSTLRPPVVLARGISQRFESWQQRQPVLHRRLTAAAITLTFMGCCSFQILAPGFVDVSIGGQRAFQCLWRCGWLSIGAHMLACSAQEQARRPACAFMDRSPAPCCACCAVQLTTQWTTLGIALAQALLLRQALPRVFCPCAAAMLGGAAMVIVPSVGQSTVGSLNSARGWWGLVMAVGALLSTVIYYTLLQVGGAGRQAGWLAGWLAGRRSRRRRAAFFLLPGAYLGMGTPGSASIARLPPLTCPRLSMLLLQATRHMGFTALHLQHYMCITSILLFTCLSLPVDGTDWAAQFAGWGAPDWASLVSLGSAAYLGSGTLMQVGSWAAGLSPFSAMHVAC
jgi:hypothetical protein